MADGFNIEDFNRVVRETIAARRTDVPPGIYVNGFDATWHPRVLKYVLIQNLEIDDPKVAKYVADLETFAGQAELVIGRLNAELTERRRTPSEG